jgi:hypothetical protein
MGELRRRHVVQATGVYLVAAWGLSAGAADIFDVLNIPPSAVRYFIILLFSFTPVVIVISWLFEIDTSGIYRDHGESPQVIENVWETTLSASFQEISRSFNSDFTVGRDESCEFQIIDPLISRQHTKFECVDGRWLVRDLGSANGTTIDGKKVDTAWLEGRVSVCFYPGCPEFIVITSVDTTADTVFISIDSL